MLSFDITDKTIRIVKGYESGGKIKLNNAVTVNIDDNMVEDGKVYNIPAIASKIEEALKSNGMKEKEAVVSISSNATIFKELSIPKAKGAQFVKMVRAEMQAQLGIDSTYSVSYVIVDEYEESSGSDDKSKGRIVDRILATACPNEMLESYRSLFSSLSISLKSVMISCNCISKVILSDVKSRLRMPLLAVQIDENFLNVNLYDDSKLAFSRFSDIKGEDYNNDSDYIIQAVNENIFRMVQFQKTRKSDKPIENIILYGDMSNADEIISAVEQMELNVSVISVPPQVGGCENIDFPFYANAIGALFKRNKSIERVNLLETDSSGKNKIKSDKSYTALLVGSLAASLLLVGGVWFPLNLKYNDVADDLSSVQDKINSDDTREKKEMFDTLSIQEDKIDQYHKNIKIASDAFKTHTPLSYDYISIIEGEMANAAAELGLWAQITDLSYSEYTITLSIMTASNSDPSQKLPSLIVAKLLHHNEFADVLYTGYSLSVDTLHGKVVNYEIKIPLSPIELPTEASTEAATEATQN